MDSHWPSPTAITKVSPFYSCTQKQHHIKMFTGQKGSAEERRHVHRGRTDVLLWHWLVAKCSTSSKLGGYSDRLPRTTVRWKDLKELIWFHLSICIWPSNGRISFRCYTGKEILWRRSGCSNLSLILCKCCWTVLLHLLSSMFCDNHRRWSCEGSRGRERKGEEGRREGKGREGKWTLATLRTDRRPWWQLLVSVVPVPVNFEKVLLKIIEYFKAQKCITNTSINTCW